MAVIGNMPPPVTGQAAITLACAEALAARGPAPRLSLSPGRATGPLRHPVRTLLALRAAVALAVCRAAGGTRAYAACDGGWGRIHILVLVLSVRAMGMRLRLHHHSFAYIDRPDRLMRVLLRAGGPGLSHVFLSPGMRRRFRAAYGRAGEGRDLVISNAVFLRPGGRARSSEASSATTADTAAPAQRGSPSPLVIGLLANLDAAKGLHDMIALARLLAARGRRERVRLAGPVRLRSDRAALEAALAEPGLRLDWTGPLHGPAKAAFYASLDLFALPTRHLDEAQPAVIFEAAFAGVPTLAFARGAIEEQVGDPWLLRAPGADFAPWAAARAAALAEDRTRLRLLGETARRRAEREAFRGSAALSALLAELGGRPEGKG